MQKSTNTRKRRQVLVDPDGNKDFVIDEEDYRVVYEINMSRFVGPYQVKDIVEIDDDQRVSKLSPNPSVVTLPEKIGNLVSLKTLDLASSDIASLPPSIGRLTNLKCLCLRDTLKLIALPEEIGDLVSLNTLDLYGSNIISLPPSIGRLMNLEELNLEQTSKLVTLPEEIGDLVSLKTLDLDSSDIASLPPSIGRLTNLKCLYLHKTQKLVTLPEEIGNLVSLESLHLRCSNITSLPPSIGRLKNLECLPYYPSINYCPVAKKVYYGIACKIGRKRTGLGAATGTYDSVPISSKLWPLVLHNATRAFQPFPYDHIVKLQKTDAIYQLLEDGRESFLGVLVNRETTTDLATI